MRAFGGLNPPNLSATLQAKAASRHGELDERQRQAGGAVCHLSGRSDPSVGRLCGGQASGRRGLQRRGAAADLLRPAGVQFRRPRHRARDRRAGYRGVRALRLCRGAVGLVRRHAQGALPGTVSAGDPNWRARADAFAAKSFELVSFLVDVLRVERVDARFRRHGDLSRFLLGPARTRRACPAAATARHGAGLAADRNARRRCLLRIRRHVLRQVSRTFPTPSSKKRRPMSPRPARIRCLPAILAA